MVRINAILSLATNIATIILGLITSMVLSKILGPTGRGELAASMLWPTILIWLSSFGLISSTLYFTASLQYSSRDIYYNASLLAFFQGGLAFLCGYLALPWLLSNQELRVIEASQIYMVVIPVSLLTQYGLSVLQGNMKLITLNLARIIIPIGYLVGTLFLVTASAISVYNIILVHIFLNIITLIVVIATLCIENLGGLSQLNTELMKRMLRYGAQVHVGHVSGFANLNLDQVLMAAFLPSNQLGLYVVAVSTAGLGKVLSQAVQTVITPHIARQASQSAKLNILTSSFRIYWMVSMMVSLSIALILPMIIPVAFGKQFIDSIFPAEILLFGTFLLGAKEVLVSGAQALGDPWLGSQAQLVALIVTIVALSLLLPSLGIVGAAIASAVAYMTQLIVVVVGLQRKQSLKAVTLFYLSRYDFQVAFSKLR